jgi:hypothetical protein
LKEGSYFIVVCSVYEGSLPLFFQWTKDNEIISDTRIKVDSIDEMSSKLSIKKVTSKDSGNYTCSVKNAFGSDSHSTSLQIKGSSYFC